MADVEQFFPEGGLLGSEGGYFIGQVPQTLREHYRIGRQFLQLELHSEAATRVTEVIKRRHKLSVSHGSFEVKRALCTMIVIRQGRICRGGKFRPPDESLVLLEGSVAKVREGGVMCRRPRFPHPTTEEGNYYIPAKFFVAF